MRAISVALRRGLTVAVSLCACDQTEAPPPETRSLVWFLRRLHDVSYLPELDRSVTEMESTWDRSNGNTDWAGYSRIEGDAYVPVDIDGPGCIHRIYTGVLGPLFVDVRIEITLDHAARPVIDMPLNDFLSEDRGVFPPPLVTTRSYPGSLFPIPFARHARVRIIGAHQFWGGYWQITWSRYAPGTPVESLRLPLNAEERDELSRVRAAWSLAERERPPLPSGLESVRLDDALPPGGARRVDLSGVGTVRELRLAVTPSYATRFVYLVLHWDGSNTAAAEVSVGDLFGVAAYGSVAENPFSSLLMGARGDELWTRLPMPFARGARVAVENRAPYPVRIEGAVEVDRLAEVPSNWGRFHVTRISTPAAGPDAARVQGVPVHEVLDLRGRGKYVGVMMQVAWRTRDWWGEGDWLIWTDDDAWPPRYHGTGTEEYFNSGWERFDRQATAGFITFQPAPVAVYAFHMNDAFQFQRSLRVQVETTGHPGAEVIIARDHPAWTTAAFWYGEP